LLFRQLSKFPSPMPVEVTRIFPRPQWRGLKPLKNVNSYPNPAILRSILSGQRWRWEE
jgi:hypothetical protein